MRRKCHPHPKVTSPDVEQWTCITFNKALLWIKCASQMFSRVSFCSWLLLSLAQCLHCALPVYAVAAVIAGPPFQTSLILCWHVVGALAPVFISLSDSISLPALFFRMQMRICFSVQGEARARWLTCSEPMLTVHFDMTFKSHSPREQMMTPNTHRGAHLPWCGVYCGATDHLYPGPLFICHYKFSRPFRW